jgi:metacaspase-1
MSFLGTSNSKLALIIGINYVGMNGELRGCINDTEKIIDFLKSRCGYSDSNIVILTDDTDIKPTKNNILNAIDNFVAKANSENIKELWFSYSGHGTYTSNYGEDSEKDNKDEALVPLDYNQSGIITDDVLNSRLVRSLHKEANLFSIIDACHSGTSLDLPFIYRCDSNNIEEHGIEEHGIEEENVASVCKISGCRDNQTSADAFINSKFQGALTFTFIKTLNDFRYNMTPKQIISRMKNFIIQNGYTQIPTLAFSKKATLDCLLIGDDSSFKPNVNIYIEGDQWCNKETIWNILDKKNNKMIFNENRRFFMANEKINYQFDLEDGTYNLIFNDSYGDGGVKGSINYVNLDNTIEQGPTLKDFVFNTGSHKSIEFIVECSQNVISNPFSIEKKDINFEIVCDYYGSQESKWNIVDSLERNIFDGDKTFDSSNERQKFDVKISPGKYRIKLIDTYGDGGINGIIRQETTTILDFKWSNLDWSNNNGYLKYIDFIVRV